MKRCPKCQSRAPRPGCPECVQQLAKPAPAPEPTPSLFDAVRPVVEGKRATSRAAAASIPQGRAVAQWLRVLGWIVEAGERGATDEEIGEGLDLSGDTVRPRRGSLARPETGEPYIADSGRTRPTRHGNRATVWTATERGVALWETTARRAAA
jgi:hypothetical protein